MLKTMVKMLLSVVVILSVLDFVGWVDRPFDAKPSMDLFAGGADDCPEVVRLNLYKSNFSGWPLRSTLDRRKPVFTTDDPRIIRDFFMAINSFGDKSQGERIGSFLAEVELGSGHPAGYIINVYPRTAWVDPFPPMFLPNFDTFPCEGFLQFLAEHGLLPEGCVLDPEREENVGG